MASGRRKRKRKEEKVHRAGLDHVPPLETERGGVVDPCSHPPTLRAGDSRRRRVDGGDLFFCCY